MTMKLGQFRYLNKGDLLFWSSAPSSPPIDIQTEEQEISGASEKDFGKAVSDAGGDQAAPFHVALVASIEQIDQSPADRSSASDQSKPAAQLQSIDIIHASTRGVIREKLHDYCAKKLETYPGLEITHCAIEAPNVDDQIKICALDFAASKLGCEYNDIFAEDCRNSNGKEAYYCCQLVRKSYEHALGEQEGIKLFKVHPLNFRRADTTVIRYWSQYFKDKNREIPENEMGSNPSSLMKSKYMKKMEKIIVRRE